MLTKFGKQLRNLRIETDQRLKDMAERLGVTAAYLSAVENGKRAIPDSWVEILANEYKLSELEIKELYSLAYENKQEIKLNLRDATEIEAGLALSFARCFKSLSDAQVSELQKILDEN